MRNGLLSLIIIIGIAAQSNAEMIVNPEQQKIYEADRERQRIFSAMLEQVDTIFIGTYTGECKRSSNSAEDWQDFFLKPNKVFKGKTAEITNVRIWRVPSCSYLKENHKYLVLAYFSSPENYQAIRGAYDPASWYAVANKSFVIPLD